MNVRDPITERLRELQKPQTAYLWVPADAIIFTPHVLLETFGDGRALFGFGTINSRPAYWIIRGCSTWGIEHWSEKREASREAPDFGEFTDKVMEALELEFGRAESGETYEWDGDIIRDLDQDAAEGDMLTEADISYPIVNSGGGCHWCRLDWPDEIGVPLIPHPFNQRFRILANIGSAEVQTEGKAA